MKSHHRKGEPRYGQPSQQLRDMRAVYKGRLPEEGESPGLKACRELFEKDKTKFLAQLNTMEREYQARRATYSSRRGSTEGVSGTKPVGDEGTDRVNEIIERILKEATDDVGGIP